MITLKEIYKRESKCLDGRDMSRLMCFIPVEDWSKFGFSPKEGVDISTIKVEPFTKENVLKKLESDLRFAFEKALNRRGISSSLMFEVIKMWMWVLEDPLKDFEDYPMYGLPLFKAVALKYGFFNPIGEDSGSEEEYDSGE